MTFKTAVALMLASTAVLAADSPPAAPDFATLKAQILAHLSDEMNCVQAASTLDELHACRPRPPGGHPPPPPENK
jgi:hypothetical protein